VVATGRALDACGVRVVGMVVVETPPSWRNRPSRSRTGPIL
jgi:hypothetical protein